MPPALLKRAHVALEGARVDVRDLAQARDGFQPARLGGLEIAVRPERWYHPSRERRVGREHGVRRQVVAWIVGSREHLDPEPLVQRARTVGVHFEALDEVVV